MQTNSTVPPDHQFRGLGESHVHDVDHPRGAELQPNPVIPAARSPRRSRFSRPLSGMVSQRIDSPPISTDGGAMLAPRIARRSARGLHGAVRAAGSGLTGGWRALESRRRLDARVLADILLADGLSPMTAALFDGSAHGPAGLSEAEKAVLACLAGQPLSILTPCNGFGLNVRSGSPPRSCRPWGRSASAVLRRLPRRRPSIYGSIRS